MCHSYYTQKQIKFQQYLNLQMCSCKPQPPHMHDVCVRSVYVILCDLLNLLNSHWGQRSVCIGSRGWRKRSKQWEMCLVCTKEVQPNCVSIIDSEGVSDSPNTLSQRLRFPTLPSHAPCSYAIITHGYKYRSSPTQALDKPVHRSTQTAISRRSLAFTAICANRLWWGILDAYVIIVHIC